jgi:hypothetical protein
VVVLPEVCVVVEEDMTREVGAVDEGADVDASGTSVELSAARRDSLPGS